MHTTLSITYTTLLCLSLLAGVIMVPFTLPGTWIIVGASLVYSLVRDFQSSSDWVVIGVLVILALVGEVIEFLASTLGAGKEKIPTGAIVSSVIGGVIGVIVGVPIFLVGSLLGLLLGTFTGALIYSLVKDGNVSQALRRSWFLLTSRVIAIFAKTSVAVGMAIYVLIKVF